MPAVRIACVGLVVALAGGLPLGATAAPLPANVDLPPQLPDDARTALQRTIDEATATGVPTTLLVDKIREGLAKRVPAPRIVAVVQGYSQSLGETSALVRQVFGASPEVEQGTDGAVGDRLALMRALAEARAVQVQAAPLRALLGQAGSPTVALSGVCVLTELVSRGYPRDAAVRIVTSLTRTRPAALPSLVGIAERARLRGAGTLEALSFALRELDRGPSPGGRNSSPDTTGGRGLGPVEKDDADGKSGLGDEHGPDRETNGARGRGKAAGKGKP